MAVYITGDTHGEFRRFNIKSFYEQKMLSKSDYMIICGDFGGLWGQKSLIQLQNDILGDRSYTTLFVDGNHENYDLLKTFPITEWHGGKVQYITDTIIHLMRGQVYDIDGNTYFTMGGAASHDIEDGILEPDDVMFRTKKHRLDRRGAMYRINHISWWREEMPNDEEYAEGIRNLEKHNYEVDYIISHCAPTSIQELVSKKVHTSDALNEYLESIKIKTKFKKWFFGHYHDDREISDNFMLMYKEIYDMQNSTLLNKYIIKAKKECST